MSCYNGTPKFRQICGQEIQGMDFLMPLGLSWPIFNKNFSMRTYIIPKFWKFLRKSSWRFLVEKWYT